MGSVQVALVGPPAAAMGATSGDHRRARFIVKSEYIRTHWADRDGTTSSGKEGHAGKAY